MTPEVKVNVNDVWSQYTQETKVFENVIDALNEMNEIEFISLGQCLILFGLFFASFRCGL